MSEELSKEAIKKFHELVKATRKQNTFERYMDDITKYLSLKFPDEDYVNVMEAVCHISNRTSVLAMDLLRERDADWEKLLRKKSTKDILRERLMDAMKEE